MKIGLVGCTKSKLNYPAPAKDLYMPSALFRGRRAYVETSCDRWFILSALHGVVSPYQDLEPYDVTLKGAPSATKRAWTARVSKELEEQLQPLADHQFEIHAGSDYWGEGLVERLTRSGASVTVPTRGLGVGQQLNFYSGGATRRSEEPEVAAGGSRRGSYEPLRSHLKSVSQEVVTFSFDDLERILGRKLPASAHNHRAWWGNQVGTHSHARSWLEAGWRIDDANLTARRVTFRRVV